MMNMFSRRILAARPTAVRHFSTSLLVPLAVRAEVPAEIEANNISEAAHLKL